MKKFFTAGLILAISFLVIKTPVVHAASTIILSKSIKSNLHSKIETDLNLIENLRFKTVPSNRTLEVMGLNALDGQTASQWLNNRVHYIISEKALSIYNLLIKKVIFSEKSETDFPNPTTIPYSLDKSNQKSLFELDNGFNTRGTLTVMSNIGSAIYFGGKMEKQVYGIKVSRGFLKKSRKVTITSPRTGIIQIGEGLFAHELAVNKVNENAFANSIFRLGTFFHEARHSDGNGASLGFMHVTCPLRHDYAGQPACDENLNGPYTIGALMITEMVKTCEENCSLKEKEILRLMAIDSASRVLKKTHKGELSKDWDPTPEGL